jgi:hypothetical protein|tara:strand:- start:2056 stop:2523 length:468 start_codon:yes stop_codon:yes gene_type:complete
MYSDSRPGVPITLRASAASTASANTGSFKDTTENFPQSGNMSVTFDVTAHTASGIAVGFDAWVDTSPDDGTTWLPIANMSRVTTSTATRVMNFHQGRFVSGMEGVIENPAAVRTVNVGTAREIVGVPYTRDVRIRWEQTSGTTVTFAVFAIAGAG